MHRDETFNLIEYLWKHPPSYIDFEEDDPPIRQPMSAVTSHGESQLQQQKVQVKVDVESTRNALRLANESRNIGAATLTELTIQAGCQHSISLTTTEQIDRIERDVESIHANLDTSNRLLRGIESIPGALANKFTKGPTGTTLPPGPIDRTVQDLVHNH